MGQDQGTGSQAVTGAQDPEQIQREIEETRGELGDTVEALAARADVKAQAKQKANDLKASAAERKEQLAAKARGASPDSAASAATVASRRARENPLPVAAAGAFIAGLVVGRLTKR